MVLYIENRTLTAVELSALSSGLDGWFCPFDEDDDTGADEQMCLKMVTHAPLIKCPLPPPLAVAEELDRILDGIYFPGGDSDDIGRPFVIVPPEDVDVTKEATTTTAAAKDENDKKETTTAAAEDADKKKKENGNDITSNKEEEEEEEEDAAMTQKVCTNALGFKPKALEYVTYETRDWSETAGFCYDFDIDEDDEDQMSEWEKIKQATQLMGTNLTDGFEINFNDDVVNAPRLYGGWMMLEGKRGAIVGILCRRVYTGQG